MTTHYNIVLLGIKLDKKLDYNYQKILISTHLKIHNIWSFVEFDAQDGVDATAQRKNQWAL